MKSFFKKIILKFLQLSLKKKLAIVLILGVVLFFGSKRFTNNQQPQYQTAQVEKGSVIVAVSETGTVIGSQTNVTSPTNGIIVELYVKNGDSVSSSQKLFKVKSTATPQEKAAAYASYLSSQNTLTAAQAKINALQSALFKANQTFVNGKGTANPITDDPTYVQQKADWQQAEADYKNQGAVIVQAQAALNSASLAYQATQDSVVTAPIAGTIANLSATIGGNVSVSSGNGTSSSSSTTSSSTSSSSSNSTVLVIGDFSALQVKVSASEVDVPKLHTGQKATISLDAFPNQTFVGTVANIDTIGTSASGVVTYNVFLTFATIPSGVRPGMTASSIIQTQRHDDVLAILSSAIQTNNGQSFVRVLKNGKITEVPVETGISSDTDTEITSGLSEGDTVVTSVAASSRTGTQSSSPFSSFGGGRGFGGGFSGGSRGGR